MPDPYTFEKGTIVIHPVGLDFPPVPTVLLLLASTAFATLTSAKLIGEAVEALIVSERGTVARAFRLRQLLPIEDA